MTWVKAGETAHWEVWYDNTVTGLATTAATVLANVEGDHTWLAGFWTGVTWQGGTVSGSTKPRLYLEDGGGGAHWGSGFPQDPAPQWSVVSSSGTNATAQREGFIAEVTEMWEFMQNKGLATQPTEGSNGEAVSLFFANHFYTEHLNQPSPKSQYAMAENWLNGGREDGVNFSYSGDYTVHQGEVVSGIVFLNYLHTQLGYTINQIIAAAAPTFTGVYKNLTGRTDNPNTAFMQLLETAYPTGVHCDLDNLYDINNPFPIHAAAIKLFRNGAWVTPASLGGDTGPNDPPNAAFNYTVKNLAVNFDAGPSTPGSNPITSYTWDFGDGGTDVGLTATHDFATGGAKTVTLTVTDSADRSSTRTQTVTTVDVSTPPVADFSSTVTGLSVAFSSALSKGGSGTITRYFWDFGDGSTSIAANPTYAYPQSNTYTVTLTVTNDLGATDSGTHTVAVAANTAGYEYFGTATPVKANISLNPAGAAVNQAIVHDNDTKEFWVTQVTAGTDTAYPERTRVVRMDANGALMGQMILEGAGHGLTLAVDYQGGAPFVWVAWDKPAAGSTREFDIVRFPWSDTGSTVQSRDNIANLDVMIPGNGGKRALFIDWEAQRACLTTFGACQLFNMSDIWARGTLYPTKTVNTPYGSANTWQGFCTYNDSVFQLFGGAKNDGDDPNVDPWMIREYSWQTGQLIKTLSLSGVEKTGATTYTSGHIEPEGLCVYDPGIAGTNPQMHFVAVTAESGPSRVWNVYNIDVKTQFEAAGSAGFIIGTTKPTEANVGAGILRPVTNTITPAGGVYTVTTKQTIADTLIKGTVVVKASGVIFENCIIEGPQANPATTSAHVLINTDDPANEITPPVFRYSTIYQKFVAPTTNAFSSRYVSIEYCNVYNVVNTITPAPAVGDADTDVKVSIRASYFHDFVFAAGSITGNTETSNAITVAGNKVNGAYATQPWTHCHAIIITSDLTTGVTVTGTNIVALWSRDKAISMMPLPYDNNNDVVTKWLSVLHLAGGRNLIFNDNWFDGGESCVYNPNTNVTAALRRNRFGRRMDKPLGLTGTTPTDDAKYYAIYGGVNVLIFETDAANRNEWEDTGNVVTRVVTVAAPAAAAAEPVPVPEANSTAVPWTGHVKFSSLATGNVLQSVERKVTTGHVFATQKTDESNGVETTVITRLNLSGTKLDSMTLRYAGHGTSIDVELINGVEYIWLTWKRTSASAADTNDIVRFPYKPGTYSTRGAVPGLQVKIPGNGSYRLVSFNWDDNFAVVAKNSTNGNRLYRRYLASNLKNGTLGTQSGVTITINDVSAPPTMQGFTTWKGYFFHYRGVGGTSNDSGDPQQIRKYSWSTGSLLQTIDVWPVNQPHLDGYAEPEGMSISGSTLIFGQTNGAAGNRHSGYWTIPLG